MDSPGGEDSRKDGWWLAEWGAPHLCADKPGGTTGEQDRLCYPEFQCGEIKLQNLQLKKSLRGVMVGETPSLTRELPGQTHRDLEHTQTHPPGKQHQKVPICLWVVGEVTETWQRVEQAPLFPLRPLPHRQRHSTVTQ